MIIEQAAVCLPEILVGSGYAKQDYEAGIVSALSLAILQELNGRGIANPISCLCAEKRYLRTKNLRADLHVRLARLYSGSQAYSEFGFRHSNWIEAKFFKVSKGTPPSTQNLGAVVADLIRLVVLVPAEWGMTKDKEKTDRTKTGRYFLHAYRGDPLTHLNPNRKAKGANSRAWVQPLLSPGSQRINDFELDQESSTFVASGLEKASLEVDLTNFVFKPVQPSGNDYYTIVLSRIDSASFSHGSRKLVLGADRTLQVTPNGELEVLQKEVASILKPSKTGSDATDSGKGGREQSESAE